MYRGESIWLNHSLAHHAQAGQRDVELGGDGNLRHCRVPHPEEVGHLQLGVGQGDGLVEELYGTLEVASLHFYKDNEDTFQCPVLRIHILHISIFKQNLIF